MSNTTNTKWNLYLGANPNPIATAYTRAEADRLARKYAYLGETIFLLAEVA